MSNQSNDQILETAGERMGDLTLLYQVSLDTDDLEMVAAISREVHLVLHRLGFYHESD